MERDEVVFKDSPDTGDGFHSVIIETLDGNGEYVNEVTLIFPGHVTEIRIGDWG